MAELQELGTQLLGASLPELDERLRQREPGPDRGVDVVHDIRPHLPQVLRRDRARPRTTAKGAHAAITAKHRLTDHTRVRA
ncbi:hypothetical protein [Ornithinimicrobium sp. CNJ-824]|uniref:hypothetical protein n=1 Tax=Ornithinimicrobium sp. CNJ-824 TaxID=1904966 RepID=UPI0026ADBF56